MCDVYQQRRTKLMQSVSAPAMIVLFSGEPPMRSADEEYPFSVDRSFYYMTGLEDQGMALVIKMISESKVEEELYMEAEDDVVKQWEGRASDKGKASAISGIALVLETTKLSERLHGFLRRVRGEGTVRLGLDLWKYKHNQGSTNAQALAERISKEYPAVIVEDIYDKLVQQRLIKSKEEIKHLKEAQDTTKQALCKLMKYVKPGMNECEIEGFFEFQLRKQGVRETAFPSIMAGGSRATVLHYRDNNKDVLDGELLLMDLGSVSRYYCADISRTIPINGFFTKEQKVWYNIVLEAMELVIQAAKPGMTLKDLDDIVKAYYGTKLKEKGYLKGGKKVEDFYYHGVSHHLGLDTHDIYCNTHAKLKKGMVITIEPGLYDAVSGMGIRIEDDILITEKGAENLSKGIPKTIKEIESLMNKR